MEFLGARNNDGVDRFGQAQAYAKRHDVQFYDDDEFLCEGVGRFLAEGIRAAQPAIVIATPAHRRAFETELRRHGIDVHSLHPLDYVCLDARETLSAFMEGGSPSPELFDATVGNVFEKVVANRSYVTVRAYGEMVDLLWREGKPTAALVLEELWNALASKYAFALLCAYAKESFAEHHEAMAIERICALHTNVLPSRPARTT
jgi:hypothetical protein